MNQLLRILDVLIMLVFLVTACSSINPGAPPTSLSPAHSRLKPGDSIQGMTLMKGSAEAAPLWAFCSSPQQNEQTTITECHISLSTKLAIGQFFFPTDETLIGLDGSDFTWELSIDGQSLDVDAFGIYDSVTPATSHPPCPVREVFIQSTSRDIVLSKLKPGTYTLRALAQGETGTYTWIINLVIEPLENF